MEDGRMQPSLRLTAPHLTYLAIISRSASTFKMTLTVKWGDSPHRRKDLLLDDAAIITTATMAAGNPKKSVNSAITSLRVHPTGFCL